ncbi:MAG: peptide deformylase [Candidatus Riflebacteria bacterium]|nr:peptide deformylase [Candidatus Riflebacteria bacterium]
MAVLDIALVGNPVLRQKARQVTPEEIRSDRIQTLIVDMVETMRVADGVGLAAPQVHESLRLIVLEVKGDPNNPDSTNIPLMVLFNVKFLRASRELVDDWEGCLSVPDLRGMVERHAQVEVQALDENGKLLRFVATDFMARIIQHESDHLDGLLFLDRMDDLSSLTHVKEFARAARAERDAG